MPAVDCMQAGVEAIGTQCRDGPSGIVNEAGFLLVAAAHAPRYKWQGGHHVFV